MARTDWVMKIEQIKRDYAANFWLIIESNFLNRIIVVYKCWVYQRTGEMIGLTITARGSALMTSPQCVFDKHQWQNKSFFGLRVLGC